MVHKLGKSDLDMTTAAWQEGVTDEDIRSRILNGKKGPKRMPAFKDRFSDEQIQGLVEYVRALGPKD